LNAIPEGFELERLVEAATVTPNVEPDAHC